MKGTPALLLAMSLVLGTANINASAQSSPAGEKEGDAPREVPCNDAIYPFLPGEFNFCLARRMWARKDYKDAEQMLLLAAGWGSKPAQHMLGLAYLNGAGLAMDRPRGLAWLELAAERKDPGYLATSRSARNKATSEERAKADSLYQQLRERYRDDVAAARAEVRFVRETNALAGNPVYQKDACVAGLTSDHVESPIAEDGSLTPPSCPPLTYTMRILRDIAEPYFTGWKGRVDVGIPEQVDGPSPRKSLQAPVNP